MVTLLLVCALPRCDTARHEYAERWYHRARIKESRHDHLPASAPDLERWSPRSAPRAVDAAHARPVSREGAANDQAPRRRRRDPGRRPAAVSRTVPRSESRTDQRDLG